MNENFLAIWMIKSITLLIHLWHKHLIIGLLILRLLWWWWWLLLGIKLRELSEWNYCWVHRCPIWKVIAKSYTYINLKRLLLLRSKQAQERTCWFELITGWMWESIWIVLILKSHMHRPIVLWLRCSLHIDKWEFTSCYEVKLALKKNLVIIHVIFQ